MNKLALYLITLLGLCLTQPMAHAMSVQWTDYGYDNNGNVSEKPRRFVGVLDRSEATCPAGVSSREAAANQLYDGDSGEIVGQYEYDPYGNTIKAEGQAARENNIRFSTKEYDSSTGLYYYGYRYYDPVTGRWPSRDPIEENGGMNFYNFTTNDPLNKWDNVGLIVFPLKIDWQSAQNHCKKPWIFVSAKIDSMKMGDWDFKRKFESKLALLLSLGIVVHTDIIGAVTGDGSWWVNIWEREGTVDATLECWCLGKTAYTGRKTKFVKAQGVKATQMKAEAKYVQDLIVFPPPAL